MTPMIEIQITLALLGAALLLCAGTLAYADENPFNPSFDGSVPIFSQAATDRPITVCGGASGHRSPSLEIRGAEITALWRRAYHMLVPSSALADAELAARPALRAEHGPAWRINLNHGHALMTLETKW
jgi:hypothetical protein